MNAPGWKFRGLHRDLEGNYSVSVNGHWRMTFTFENGDVVLVNYQEHHLRNCNEQNV